MGTPSIGHKSYLQIGKESTYGTGVAATGPKLEVISADISPQIGVIDDPSLYSAVARRGIYQGGLLYGGRFSVRANYEGMLRLLEGVLPGASKVGPTETTVYTYTFKEATTLNSYTFELIEGDIATTKCQDIYGVMFTGMTIKGTAGQGPDAMVQCDFEVIAKDKSDTQTPTGALSFPTVYPVLFHQATTVDDGTADPAASVRIRSFEVSFKNALSDDRYYLGSANIDQPLRNDFVSCEWKFTQEFQTMTLFQAAKAFTTGSPKILFQHPTTIGNNVRTGSDTTFVAPVTVGDGAYTGAGSVITQDVPAGALGVARAKQQNMPDYAERHAARRLREQDERA